MATIVIASTLWAASTVSVGMATLNKALTASVSFGQIHNRPPAKYDYSPSLLICWFVVPTEAVVPVSPGSSSGVAPGVAISVVIVVVLAVVILFMIFILHRRRKRKIRYRAPLPRERSASHVRLHTN